MRPPQLRALALLAAWCSAQDDRCASSDIPQEYTADEVREVMLSGCTGLQDSLEDVYELRWKMLEASRVHRKRLQSLEWHRLHRRIEDSRPVQFGLDAYRSTLAPYLAEGRQGELPEAEARALAAVAGRKASCSLSSVACQEVEGQLRVTALVLRSSSPKVWSALSRLPMLRALSLQARITEDVGSLSLPSLEILELYCSAAEAPRAHLERLYGEVVGRHTNLRVLVIIPGKYVEFNFDLTSFCGLTKLREVQLPDMNIHSIPDCFSEMRELRNAYFACNYLTEPPRALANLSELRSFIAFRQGEWTPCHFREWSRPALLSGVRRKDCKPIWESKCGLDDDDNPRVLCPSVGLHGTVQGFMDLGWRRLEKLWLDGGFLRGHIPEALPEAWPDIVSLDLYQNDLSGPIPASLARVRWAKLQLQGNRLSGEVPPGLLRQPICYFNLADNKELWGCVRPGQMLNDRDSFAGTGVSTDACKADAGSNDRQTEL